MKTVLLAFDNLPAELLGCYGGTSAVTPNFNQLAAKGITFNWHFGDTKTAEATSPWMTGHSSFSTSVSHENHTSVLKQRMENSGIEIAIENEGHSARINSFSELVDRSITTFQQKILSDENQSTLLWINARGVSVKLDFQMDDEESDVMDHINEVEKIDVECMRLFDTVLSVAEKENLLLIVTAARGINESGIGFCSNQTPLIFVSPEFHSPERRQELVQTIDLLPTIEEWLTCESSQNEQVAGTSLCGLLENRPSKENSWREAVFMQLETDTRAIRTSNYYLIEKYLSSTDHEPVETSLFLQPEDAWNIYNVARQHPQKVEDLHEQLQKYFNQFESQL